MRVFLSYHTPDRSVALRIKNSIETIRPNIDVFLDTTNLHYGQFWQPALFEEIERSDAFITIIGERLGNWQIREYYAASDRKTISPNYPLIPIMLTFPDRRPVANLPGLSHITWIQTDDPASLSTIESIVSALDGHTPSRSAEAWRTINPYRGMLALEEQDSDFFFGRQEETRLALEVLTAKNNRLLAFIGNSGVGKSSLVQAGILSAMRRERCNLLGEDWPESLRGSRSWTYLTIKPGDRPLKALVTAFAEAWSSNPTDPARIEQREKWIRLLQTGAASIADLIDVMQHVRVDKTTSSHKVVLYIDQGEELYARSEKAERDVFGALINRALSDDRFLVLLSMRSNYYGYLQADEKLFSRAVRIDVPPLNEDNLRKVLTEPAKLFGVTFENTQLIEHIIAESKGRPGALPLIADLMIDLWRRMQERGDGRLNIIDRHDFIRIGSALARRADAFLQQYPEWCLLVEKLFVFRLAIVPEDGEPIRRRMSREDATPEEWRVIEVLAEQDWRLVVTGGIFGEETAEVAHEVMLRDWSTLAAWFAREREFLTWRSRLGKALRRWIRLTTEHAEIYIYAVHPSDFPRLYEKFKTLDFDSYTRRRLVTAFLMGIDLFDAEGWLVDREEYLSPLEKSFVKASVEVDRSETGLRLVHQQKGDVNEVYRALRKRPPTTAPSCA